MASGAAALAEKSESIFIDDIQRTAWSIAARHLTAGQKDVTKMIADGIRHERARCAELVEAALGPDAEIAVFVGHPNFDW